MTSENQQGPSEAELLQAWLSSRDVPCPVCGYNLRSIEVANCPECGAKLDLRVGSTDLRIGLWLVGVIALTVPLGFIGLLVLPPGLPRRRQRRRGDQRPRPDRPAAVLRAPRRPRLRSGGHQRGRHGQRARSHRPPARVRSGVPLTTGPESVPYDCRNPCQLPRRQPKIVASV